MLNLSLLESLQCEVGRCILHLPKTTANIVRMSLLWPSVRACTLCIKLGSLLEIVKSEDSLSSRAFRLLCYRWCRITGFNQCRFFRSSLRLKLHLRCDLNPDSVSYTQIKKDILDKDISLLSESEAHPSQHFVHSIAPSPHCSWLKVWDYALEKGAFGTCLLALLRLHVFLDNQCPLSGYSQSVTNNEIVAHFLLNHTTLNITAEQCMESLKTCSEAIYDYGKALNQVYRILTWNKWFIVFYSFVYISSCDVVAAAVFSFVPSCILHKGNGVSIRVA